jgi:hypothetical protein
MIGTEKVVASVEWERAEFICVPNNVFRPKININIAQEYQMFRVVSDCKLVLNPINPFRKYVS